MKMTLIEKLAISIIIFVVVMIIASSVLYGFLGIKLINEPEVFGEWFQRLIGK